MKKKRIAFFLGSMGRGGAEKVISVLSREYAEKGWDTDIGLLLSDNVDYMLDETTRIMNFTGNTTSRILRVPMWLKSIRAYAKKEKPDVIVSFTARINILVMIACMGLKVKTIISERNDPMYDGRGIVTRFFTKILYPKADRIIFQTKRVKEQFSKTIQEKGVIISNPISISCEGLEKKEKKVVSVGRLAKQKNHKMLINAFVRVLKKYPEYKLCIYGEGDMRKELTELIKGLGVSENVVLPGNILNVHKEIANAECFVLSSDYEGLSNALLEAMMMGLPCIATECAGADEYIIHKENGLLIPTGDMESMEKAILYMIENEQKRILMGQAAKQASEKFTQDKVLKIWHSVID